MSRNEPENHPPYLERVDDGESIRRDQRLRLAIMRFTSIAESLTFHSKDKLLLQLRAVSKTKKAYGCWSISGTSSCSAESPTFDRMLRVVEQKALVSEDISDEN